MIVKCKSGGGSCNWWRNVTSTKQAKRLAKEHYDYAINIGHISQPWDDSQFKYWFETESGFRR